MVFGFGKVGRGIVKYLLKETRFITIVEQSLEYVSHAKKMGINGLHVSETDKIQHCAREAFALVTATGQMNILSTYVNPKHCPNAYIVNMGAEDEIGEGFQHEKILYQRKAINFSLKHPTLLHFIDPIFYAHNLSAQLLMENTLAGGYHAFPTYLDDLIIQLWNAYYPMDISDIYF
jgi:adenosylhomocysteinase